MTGLTVEKLKNRIWGECVNLQGAKFLGCKSGRETQYPTPDSNPYAESGVWSLYAALAKATGRSLEKDITNLQPLRYHTHI